MTSPAVPEIVVRPLAGGDRDAWQSLWRGYLDFYDEDVDDEVTDVVFQRLVDPGWPAQFGRVAEVEGQLLGLAHCGLQPSTWAVTDDCYLEDLFVDPTSRGNGVGRALLDALVAEGREEGWRKLHWLTETGNAAARRLYDEVGALQDQVRYTIDR